MEYHEDVFYDNNDNEIEVEVVFEKEWQEAEQVLGIPSGWVPYFVEQRFVYKEHKKNWEALSLEDKVGYREKWMENIERKLELQ